MGYAGDVLFSAKQRGHGLEESPATLSRLTGDIGSKALGRRAASGADSSLLRRSVKGLVIGGLAASWGYSLGGLESGAGRTADVARGFGGFPVFDTGLVQVGGVTRAEDIEAVEFMNSCVQGLIAGGAGALFFQNPLPLVIGLGGCFPKANAQQRIGGEFQVNTYTSSEQWLSSVASFDNGNFVTAWTSDGQDGSVRGVYGQLFNENANRIGNEFQVNTYTTLDQQWPFVASFDNDNFVVTWYSDGQDGSDFGVYGQLFYGNSSRIGGEFQVNTYTNGYQSYPSVAGFVNGNFVVTWNSYGQDGSNYGIYGQLFDGNANRIGNEFQINSYATGEQRFPSAAIFSNGNFVVTWESHGQDGSGRGVYGQLFDGNASRIENEFQINAYISSSQWDSSVINFNSGYFVVTWTSDGQDGLGRGVYGQLFEGPVIASSTISTTSEMTTSSSSLNATNEVTTSSSSIILSSTSNPPTSSTDETTINSFTASHSIIISSTTTTSSTFLTTSRTSDLSSTSSSSNSSISSNELITTSISSTENSEITSSEDSNSNVGLIIGIIAGVGGGGLIVLLTYLYLNKKGAKNPEEVDLETNSKGKEIIYANTPEKPEDDEYANYPKGVQEEIHYANAPKGTQEDEYANMPNKTE